MDIFLSGVAPEHAAALIAGLLALAVVPFLRNGSRDHVDHVDRCAAALLGFTAAVHLFLPFGHLGGMTVPYLLSAFAFGALAYAAHLGRRGWLGWRPGAGILCPATVVAYLIWAGDIDQVGILTALVELTVFGLALSGRKVLCGIATILAVLLSGAVMWIASFKAHQATNAGSPGVGHHDAHGHEHLARAQAGVIMRPLKENRGASSAETAAAISLVQAVSSGTKYKRLSDAIASGYKYPLGKREGMDVHMENPEFKKDGRVLDPERPEMLVYAIEGGKATLLGVVFVMERADQPGPAPGGSITRWHAHNLCVSFLPIGIGIVTPFGGCPSLSLAITIPEMMHVWIVDPPGGPYAEGVDKDWALGYHRERGVTL